MFSERNRGAKMPSRVTFESSRAPPALPLRSGSGRSASVRPRGAASRYAGSCADDIGVCRVIGQEHALEPGHQLAEDLHPLRAEVDVQISRPVMLPPGRARLCTRPILTGSLPPMKMIGICFVAACAAFAVLPPSPVAMMSTPRRTAGHARLRQARRVAVARAHADHELLVLTVAGSRAAVAQTDDRGCRPPGFGQRARS